MEQAGRVDIGISKGSRVERVYEKYGWLILAVSAIFGIVAALVVTVPAYYMLTHPLYQDFYPVMLAWGITWVGFNLLALTLILIPFRRGERWAWYTLWMLPLLWLSLFALAPDLHLYLAFAVITAAGLILPYRRFFPRMEESAL
jgi:hypothetical protein